MQAVRLGRVLSRAVRSAADGAGRQCKQPAARDGKQRAVALKRYSSFFHHTAHTVTNRDVVGLRCTICGQTNRFCTGGIADIETARFRQRYIPSDRYRQLQYAPLLWSYAPDCTVLRDDPPADLPPAGCRDASAKTTTKKTGPHAAVPEFCPKAPRSAARSAVR